MSPRPVLVEQYFAFEQELKANFTNKIYLKLLHTAFKTCDWQKNHMTNNQTYFDWLIF